MTSPRSHSQKVVLGRILIRLSSAPPLTRPASAFSPHCPSQLVAEPGTPRSKPRVKFPAGLGQTTSAVTSLWSARGPPRPNRSPRPASRRMPGAQRLRVPGVRASLRKVARPQPGAPRALPATRGGGPA